MPSKAKRATEAVDPNKLKRETAGRYTTADSRFTVEQGSGGWMIVDGEQTNELGLPLVRGPFPTLDEARDGLDAARSGAVPASDLATRMAELKQRGGQPDGVDRTAPGGRTKPRGRKPGDSEREAEEPAPKPPPSIEIREFRPRDGDDLRSLWNEARTEASPDDNASLKRLAERNPGLVLVAVQEKSVVGVAIGTWDGRRGWIQDVAVAAAQRRTDVAARLIRAVEDRLRDLGAEQVNAAVPDDDPGAALLWEAAKYDRVAIRIFRRELTK